MIRNTKIIKPLLYGVFGILALFLFVIKTYANEFTFEPPHDYQPQLPDFTQGLDKRFAPQAPSTNQAPVIRVYKNYNAWWGENRDQATLIAMGKILGNDWFVHPMIALQAGIPSNTRVVLITSASNGNFFGQIDQQNHPAAQANLASFVQDGGILIIDMGDNANPGGYTAPGAVGTPSYIFPSPCADATLAPAALGPDGILGTADDHPIVIGPDGIPGTNDDLTNTNIDMISSCFVAHGNLVDGISLPPGAVVLMTAKFGGIQKPILVEYPYGSGRVILDTITKEFIGHQPFGTGASFFMRNLFSYAFNLQTLQKDTTPPVILPSVTPLPNGSGWNNTNVTVSWSVTDPESGISSSSGCTSTSLTTETSGTVLTCVATNGAGLSNSAFVTIKIDKTPPVISASSSPLPNAAGWNNTNVTVSFSCSDSLSGIASCSGPVTVTTEGSGQVIAGSARDLAGNSATASRTVNIDKTPPTTSTTLSGLLGVTCYSSDVGVSLKANDNLSGVSSTLYSLDGGIWQAYTGIFTVTTEGVHLVKYKSTDKAGNNEAEKGISFTIDKTPPEAILRFDPTSKDIKVYNSETSGEASYIVLPSNEDKDDEEDQDEGAWELRQYTLKDCANNSLILVLRHKLEGKEVKVRVISMQYNGAQVIDAAKNKQEAEYAEDKIGSIRELEQKIKVKKQFEVEAKFESKKNETEIKVRLEGQKEDKDTKPGLVILRLSTNKGGLTYSY